MVDVNADFSQYIEELHPLVFEENGRSCTTQCDPKRKQRNL
jgi:hypothetical protein